MKKNILAFLLLSFVSCQEEDITPTETETNTTTNNTNNNSSLEFYVDGYKHNPTTIMAGVHAVPNQPNKFRLTLQAMTLNGTSATHSIVISSFSQMVLDTVTIPIENNGSNTTFNSFSYLENASIVYNNSACDEDFQGGTAYGEPGEIKITYLNASTKKMSGTFKMKLCKSLTEHVEVHGNFNNIDFILTQ